MKSGSPYWLRVASRLVVLVVVLLLIRWLGDRVVEAVAATVGPAYARWGDYALAVAIPVYIVFMALPFVPGMEIALALMLLFGVKAIVLVYCSTLGALVLSFVVGRLVPLDVLAGLFRWLHLARAADLVAELARMDGSQRLGVLLRRAPTRLAPWLLRHRYLTIGLIFNLPGNAVIGGGGGIALMAGMSRFFSLPAYVVTVALAISPVPLFLLFAHRLPPAGY